jgi:uncharacterized membrane protein
MQNKQVGYLLLGISVLIIIIIFMFKSALTSFVNASCTLAHGGNSCPMYDTITTQTYLALGIVGIIILVGLILLFSRPEQKVIVKTRNVEMKPQKMDLDISGLKSEEKQVLSLIQSARTIFQAELIERTSFSKAKMTRIIDRLEGRGFVERKRRGMTNVVVIKD